MHHGCRRIQLQGSLSEVGRIASFPPKSQFRNDEILQQLYPQHAVYKQRLSISPREGGPQRLLPASANDHLRQRVLSEDASRPRLRDPAQRLFVYQRHGSSRYSGSHNELPPAHGTDDEKQDTTVCLRLCPEGYKESASADSAMIHFGWKKRFDGSENSLLCKRRTAITKDTEVLFQWCSGVPVPQVHSEEPPGQNVDLDELFGTASNNQ